MVSEQQAWAVLAQVLDPEVPVLSVCDLGIVREVHCSAQGTQVVLTPTYSGCPAPKSSRTASARRCKKRAWAR